MKTFLSDASETRTGQSGDQRPPLLEVRDLRVNFHSKSETIRAVNGLSYTLGQGETLAIVGESGAGKSVAAQAVMRILDPRITSVQGSIRYRDKDLLDIPEIEMRRLRGAEVAMVFQDALASLNPYFPVGWQISEVLIKKGGLGRKDARSRSIELLERVQIPSADQRYESHPHELSGGMRQRAMIAMAIALDPEILIADEPTTALDVTIESEILNLLKKLQAETGMGLILITHDLGVVRRVADRICVMYAGRAFELGGTTEVLDNPANPYTEGLLNSVPRAETRHKPLKPIEGAPPDPTAVPSGCPFHPRCAYRRDICFGKEPPLYEIGDGGRASACHFWDAVLA